MEHDLNKSYTLFGSPCSLTNRKIGGSICIISARITSATWQPIISFGISDILHCKIGKQVADVVGIYLPCDTNSPGGLSAAFKEIDPDGDVDILKTTLSSCQTTSIIFGGDFNLDIQKQQLKKQYDLSLWAANNQLTTCETPDQLNRPSYSLTLPNSENHHCSRIDYIWCKGVQQQTVQIAPVMESQLDHKMLLSTFTTSTITKQHSPVKLTRLLDVKRDDKAIDKLKEQLQDCIITPNATAEDIINYFTLRTVQIVQSLKSRSQVKRKHFTPRLMSLHVNLRWLKSMHRHFEGIHHCNKWTIDTFDAGLKLTMTKWRQDQEWINSWDRTNDALRDQHTFGRTTWAMMTMEDTKQRLSVAIKAMQKSLHRQRHADLQKHIRQCVLRRRINFQKGNVKKVLDSLMERNNKCEELDTLLHNGILYTNQSEICKIVNNHFSLMFKIQPDIDPNSANGINGTFEQWDTTWDQFQIDQQHHNIPTHLVRIIWEALQKRPTDDQHNEMTESLNKAPTLDEFNYAIKHSPKNKAPGVSGLSVNMINCWPMKIVTAVYEALVTMWHCNKIPTQWHWRFLAPLPKKENPTLADLRPLMLLECLRKIWISCFVRKIQQFWHRFKLLNDMQYGFQSKTSAEAAIMIAMNAMETSADWFTDNYWSSFDIKGAFDSPSKSLLVFAWVRLGVPVKLAQYMVDMDVGPHTFVRTPEITKLIYKDNLSQEHWERHAINLERGASQGDVASPSNWNAVFDILLTALQTTSTNFFCQTNNHPFLLQPLAFADDIITMTGTKNILQLTADIISAFALITNMKLATNKFRAYVTHFGTAYNVGDDSVNIHLAKWTSINVPLESSGIFKYLGVEWDISLQGNSIQAHLTKTLANECIKIESKDATPEMKWLAIKLVVYSRISYAARFMSWTAAELDRLDRKINVFLRRISGCTSNFPTRLLYASTQQGGLGFERISSIINQGKLRIIERATRHDNLFRHSTISALVISLRRNGIQPIVGKWHNLIFADEENTWAGSLNASLKSIGCHLALTGESVINTADESIIEYCHRMDISLSDHDKKMIIEHGVSTIGELHMDSDDKEH